MTQRMRLMALATALLLPLTLAGTLCAADEAKPADQQKAEPATQPATAPATQPGATTQPETEPSTGTIKGKVLFPPPMARYQIMASGPAGHSPKAHRVKADKDGNYEIKDLPPGTYTVLCSLGNNYGSINTGIEVKVGETTTLNLRQHIPGPAGNQR